jgi:hypothetical protein
MEILFLSLSLSLSLLSLSLLGIVRQLRQQQLCMHIRRTGQPVSCACCVRNVGIRQLAQGQGDAQKKLLRLIQLSLDQGELYALS